MRAICQITAAASSSPTTIRMSGSVQIACPMALILAGKKFLQGFYRQGPITTWNQSFSRRIHVKKTIASAALVLLIGVAGCANKGKTSDTAVNDISPPPPPTAYQPATP